MGFGVQGSGFGVQAAGFVARAGGGFGRGTEASASGRVVFFEGAARRGRGGRSPWSRPPAAHRDAAARNNDNTKSGASATKAPHPVAL